MRWLGWGGRSNLLYNDRPSAVQVRPAQAGFSIDVLVPRDPTTNIRNVDQIMKFALNLDAPQKTHFRIHPESAHVSGTRRHSMSLTGKRRQDSHGAIQT
jgi:hypothetical protein